MAKAAGVPVIAVAYGYTETPVAGLGPDRVIGALSDLPGAVFDLLDSGMAARARPR
jgi:phosphoglycolate phosphatase